MKILWFSWKDITHPEAGGAEFLGDKISSELVKDGHEVIHIVSGYKHCKKQEKNNGYTIIRVGNKFTVYWEAFRYYQTNLKGWADRIIEEINTIPFMTQWYTKEKRVLLIYQLCREIWFYQLWFPLSLIGYLMEPMYLWLLRKNYVLTESNSTKIDLIRYGFLSKKISIFPIFTDMVPIKSLKDKKTYDRFTILSFGAIRSMKRTLHQVQAFELAKKEIPELQMKIAGKPIGTYGKMVLDYIQKCPYAKDIEYLGSVSKEEKSNLMRKSHLLLVTSVKEGWGLVVTEAATQGTPSIVYDVDGLRDSVEDNEFILNPNQKSLSDQIMKYYNNQLNHKDYQEKLLKKSSNYLSKRSYGAFKKVSF